MVSGASRAPERVTEAPAAISSVDPRALVTASPFGQAPLALRNVPGVDLAQSGLTDFNVNARGFNSSLNRRVLVLQDGRDLAIAFLGSQEWNTLTFPTEDYVKMEFVSGPGSALYGANAYSGVLDITTPTAREVVGTKVTLAGGALSGVPDVAKGGATGDESGGSFRGDIRHAGTLAQGKFGYRLNFGMSYERHLLPLADAARRHLAPARVRQDATDSIAPSWASSGWRSMARPPTRRPASCAAIATRSRPSMAARGSTTTWRTATC